MNTYVSRRRGHWERSSFCPIPGSSVALGKNRDDIAVSIRACSGGDKRDRHRHVHEKNGCVVGLFQHSVTGQTIPLPSPFPAARSHEFHQSSHPTDSIFACSAPVGATATIYRGELVGPASGWVAHPALNNTAIGVEMSQDEVGRDQMPPAAAGEAE